MTSSYAKGQFRKYKRNHPWVKKLPKSMLEKKEHFVDLGILDEYHVYYDEPETPEDYRLDQEVARAGDGAWAIVYDESREAEWLWEFANNGWIDHICSLCRYTVNTDVHVSLGKEYSRCPRCGAKMYREHGIKFEENRIAVY